MVAVTRAAAAAKQKASNTRFYPSEAALPTLPSYPPHFALRAAAEFALASKKKEASETVKDTSAIVPFASLYDVVNILENNPDSSIFNHGMFGMKPIHRQPRQLLVYNYEDSGNPRRLILSGEDEIQKFIKDCKKRLH